MKEADRAEHVADFGQQGFCRLEPDAGNIAWSHEITCSQRAGARFHTEARKALEHDIGEQGEVANDEGEEADIEHLLEEARHDVGILRQRPEETGERDVYDYQCGCQVSDIAGKQAEA